MSDWDVVGTKPAPAENAGGWGVAATKPSGAAHPDALPLSLDAAKNIPGDVSDEFNEGLKQFREASQGAMAALKEGKEPPAGTGMKEIAAALQEVFAPISGTAKALVGRPVTKLAQKVLPNTAADIAGRTAEEGATMFGPGAVAKSLGVVAKALPKYSMAVKALMDEGIQMTPGQIMQGIVKHAEDSFRSFPALGDVIGAGHARSFQDFNRAVLNRALKPVGETLPKDVEPGRDAIAYVADKLGQKYDALLPKLKFQVDQQLAADITKLGQDTRTMPGERVKQLGAIIRDAASRLKKGGTMRASTYKQVESELSYLSKSYAKAVDPDQQMLGRAVDRFSGYLKDALERNNPQYAGELQTLNGAWAAFKRAENASVRRVASNGVFSPADLLASIKGATSQGVFARGDGLMQDLADAANVVLPSSVPNSGTANRVFWGELLAGTGAGLVGIPPTAIAAGAGLAAPYTKLGMKGVNAAAKAAPKVSGAIRKGLEKNLPATGPLAAGTEAVEDKQQ